MGEFYFKLRMFLLVATGVVGASFYTFAFLFGIFGHEYLGKIVGAIIGIVALVVLVFYFDHTNSVARPKARKERQALEEQYREVRLIDGND